MGLIAGLAMKLGGKAAKWAARQAFGSGGSSRARATSAATLTPTAYAGGGLIGQIARDAARGSLSRPMNGDIVRNGLRRFGVGPFGDDDEPKKYRRMNYANGRALNRAIRRLGGAEKIFKKIFRFNHGVAATKVRPKARRH